MSKDAVVTFCEVIAGNEALQTELRGAIADSRGLERFIELAAQHGCAITLDTASACFAEERRRREEAEGAEFAETLVVKAGHAAIANGFDGDSDGGRAGFRRVALSGNWRIGAGVSPQGDSIHD